jgi:creatinine amidohydrolase
MTAPIAEQRWAHRTSAVHEDWMGAATLVLPIGATEQHGPHLPVGVDAMIAEHIAVAAAERVSSAQRPVIVAPVLSFGSSHHHLPRPGTLSMTSPTLAAVLVDLLRSAAVTGYRRMFVLNGHGGNEDIARQAIRDVALAEDVTTGCAGYWSLAWDAVIAAAERHGVAPVPGHAGSFETSIVLSLWPELVADRPSRPGRPGRHPVVPGHPLAGLVVEKHHWVERIGWFTDDPSAASAEAGRAMLDVLVEGCAQALSRFIDDDAHTSPSEG